MSKKNRPKPTSPPPGAPKTGKSAGSGKSGSARTTESQATTKIISDNRKVRHSYEIIETVECGMILRGSEVKSLRNGKCQLDEAYGRVKDETLWLIGCNIAEYPQATIWNHEPKRHRQLLVHKREMLRFIKKAKEKGLTLIPLKVYFSARGLAKCEMALCRGLKQHDKREKMKKADATREIARAMKNRRNG